MSIRSWLLFILVAVGAGIGGLYFFHQPQPAGKSEQREPVDPITAARERYTDAAFNLVMKNPPDAPEAGWTRYERGPIAVQLPGKLHKDTYEPDSGSYVISTLDGPRGASLCFSPATCVNLIDKALTMGESDLVLSALRKMFPVVRSLEPNFRPMPADQGEGLMFKRPLAHSVVWVDGRVWRVRKTHAVAYLLTLAREPDIARGLADRIQASLIEKSAPEFPPDRPASGLKPTIPDDWELLIADRKKKYWVSPHGRSFILVSHPSPAPFWRTVANYGTSSGMARDALLVFEKLSGREAKVSKTELLFEPRLWIVLSRARGTAKYKAGDYIVEMDRWIDPRTEGFQRVYIGGLTPADFEAARKIRDSLVFIWK